MSSDVESRYEGVFHSLSRLDLQKGAHGLDALGLEDLFGVGNELWLGFYTEEGLQTAFEKYGFFDDFRAVGFHDVRLEVNTEDPDEHMLRFWSDAPKLDHDPLVELVVRRGTIRPSRELAERTPTEFLNVLHVEWLQMQNPTIHFSDSRPPLPGQRYPGLGLGQQVMLLLRHATRRLQLDGLATVPAYFHNALFYSEEFNYFDPDVQGLFLAMTRDVLPQAFASVPAASWALVWKMVVETAAGEESEPFAWFHDAQVAPVSERLSTYFEAPEYDADVQRSLSSHSFRVFREALKETLEAKGIIPFDAERIEGWLEDT